MLLSRDTGSAACPNLSLMVNLSITFDCIMSHSLSLFSDLACVTSPVAWLQSLSFTWLCSLVLYKAAISIQIFLISQTSLECDFRFSVTFHVKIKSCSIRVFLKAILRSLSKS